MRLDAGRAGDRIFLLMAGCGFDADVVNRLHEARKGNISRWSYIKPILDSIRSYEYPELADILRRRPSGLDATPIAARWAVCVQSAVLLRGSADRPRRDRNRRPARLFAFQGAGFWNGMQYLAGVLRDATRGFKDCVTTACVRGADRVRPAGALSARRRPRRMLPLEVEILPERLTLVVPRPPGPAQVRIAHDFRNHFLTSCQDNPAQVGPYRCGRGSRCW